MIASLSIECISNGFIITTDMGKKIHCNDVIELMASVETWAYEAASENPQPPGIIRQLRESEEKDALEALSASRHSQPSA